MGKYTDEARQLRPIIEQAVSTGALTDDQVLTARGLFAEWTPGREYEAGFVVRYGDALYRCLTAHTAQESWNPVDAASIWARTDDPAEEYPTWVQPTGGHDAYTKGAKVTHNGTRYVSNVDGNVWEPPTQWTEVEG